MGLNLHLIVSNKVVYDNLKLLAIYIGTDNRYYLERNIQRLQKWVTKVSVDQKNRLFVDDEEFTVKFTCTADWNSLQALFGPSECIYCDVPHGCLNHDTDANGNRWKMSNGDTIPKGALLPILRRNIRICTFHGNKRIFSTLFDCVLDEWSVMSQKQTETKAAFLQRKYLKQIEWELWAREYIGLGTSYTLPISQASGKPKLTRLDGNHAVNLLKQDNWRIGLAAMDRGEKTCKVWEVLYNSTEY